MATQQLDKVPAETLALLIVRSVYESTDGGPGGTEVLGVSDVQIGTPPGGWSCTAVIEAEGQKETLLVSYDGEQYTDVVQGFEPREDLGISRTFVDAFSDPTFSTAIADRLLHSPKGDRTDAEPLLPSGRGLTRDEVQRIVRDLDTQEQIDAFLATVDVSEDDEAAIVAALLESQPSEDGLIDALIALTVSGAVLLALSDLGQYNILRVVVPEGWATLPPAERVARARQGIAAADRRTVDPDDLARYRDRIDSTYRDITRGHGQALVDGAIDLEEYHRRMVGSINEAHTVQRRLGQGRLTPQDEGALLDTLNEQLGYLDEMVRQIEDGTLSPAQILDRSGRYGANGGLSFNEGMGAALGAIAVTEQRFLGACSPHCPECLDYAARGRVDVGTLPRPRQLCRCSNSCCCRLEFYDLLGQSVGWIG